MNRRGGKEIHKAQLRNVDQCVYEDFNFSSVHKEL